LLEFHKKFSDFFGTVSHLLGECLCISKYLFVVVDDFSTICFLGISTRAIVVVDVEMDVPITSSLASVGRVVVTNLTHTMSIDDWDKLLESCAGRSFITHIKLPAGFESFFFTWIFDLVFIILSFSHGTLNDMLENIRLVSLGSGKHVMRGSLALFGLHFFIEGVLVHWIEGSDNIGVLFSEELFVTNLVRSSRKELVKVTTGILDSPIQRLE
jgi:hypothetical protein